MRVLQIIFLALLSVTLAYSQTFGTITGEIKDAGGATVPGVAVTVRNTGTNATRNVTTNDEGFFSVPSLVPGIYEVKAEKTGFRTATRTGVELQVQQTARLDFGLEIGQVSENIEVSASAGMLTTENATVGTVIENRRIVDLPLNGRNFLQLVSLSPNVSVGFGQAGQAAGRQGGTRVDQNMSIAGNRASFNHYTLDGIENTDVNFNFYVMLPSIDALQEFKVQTGVYSAEFGRQAAQVNVSTKPGTNQYHGALFEFLRNEKLDATQYAFTVNRPRKGPFKWNQYGFTLGGPVWIPKLFNGRDRLFFMSNFEGYRDRREFSSVYNVPSLAMRTGDFSELLPSTVIYDPATRATVNGVVTAQPFPGNIIPRNRIDPRSIQLLEFLPAPNVNTGLLRDNFQRQRRRVIDKDQFNQRVDFVESSNSNWFGRYSWTDEGTLEEQLQLNGNTVVTKGRQYLLSNTRVLNSATVNEFRFGANDFDSSNGIELAFQRDVVGELAIPGLSTPNPATWGIPNVRNVTNFPEWGNGTNGPFVINNATFQFVDNLSWVRGKHSLKFGVEYRRDRYNQIGNEFARGALNFEGIATRNPTNQSGGYAFADYMTGYLTRGEGAVALASAQFRSSSMYAYVDDTWRVTPTLTLNLGLRYELTQPWLDRSQNEVNMQIPLKSAVPLIADQSLHPVAVRAGNGDFFEGKPLRFVNAPVARDGRLGSRLIKTDYNDFAPRLGIAWTPNAKWSVRSGAGIFYSQDSGNSRFDLARTLAGRVATVADVNFPTVRYDNFMGAPGNVVSITRPYVFGVNYDLRTSYVVQYLLNVQRELPGNTLLEVGYTGSLGRHLQALYEANEAIPGTTPLETRVAFPEWGRIQTVGGDFKSSYNSLAVKLQRRFTNGLTYLVGYTWSKSLDNASAIRGQGDAIFPNNSNCLRCEFGASAFHVPHRLTTSLLYELPFGRGKAFASGGGWTNVLFGGWQLGSIITVQSGNFVSASINTDRSNSGGGNSEDRLNATGETLELPNDQRGPDRWFNLNAFRLQPAGTFGNAGRNTIQNPGIIQFDFSTLKNFSIREGQQLQFRFEAFNLPNHPNWGGPSTGWGSTDVNAPGASFGVIRSTRSMRELQLGLKYIF